MRDFDFKNGDKVHCRGVVESVSRLSNELLIVIPCEDRPGSSGSKNFLFPYKDGKATIVRTNMDAECFGSEGLLLPNRENISRLLGNTCFIAGTVVGTGTDTLYIGFPGTPVMEIRRDMIPSPEQIEDEMLKESVALEYLVTRQDIADALKGRPGYSGTPSDTDIDAVANLLSESDMGIVRTDIDEQLSEICMKYVIEQNQRDEGPRM